MKLLRLAVLLALLGFAPALAQNGYFGAYLGYPGGIGGQYTTGSLRFSVGLPFWAGFGLEASADYLVPVPAQAQNLSFSYGGGVGLGLYGGFAVVSIFPHALGNVEYALSPALGLFWEAQLGPQFVLAGGASAFGLGWGTRVGVNFRQ